MVKRHGRGYSAPRQRIDLTHTARYKTTGKPSETTHSCLYNKQNSKNRANGTIRGRGKKSVLDVIPEKALNVDRAARRS